LSSLKLIIDDSSRFYDSTSTRLRQSLHELRNFRCRWQEWRVFDKMTQNNTEKCHFFNSSEFQFRQCCAMHMHILSIKSLSRQHQLMLETQSSWTRRDCSIVVSQTLTEDVIRLLATASRHSFVDDTVEKTLRVMWDIYLIDLDAQMIALSRLHLACALVVTMMITQHFVNNSCHANEAKNRRSAMSRKQKNAERERQKDRASL